MPSLRDYQPALLRNSGYAGSRLWVRWLRFPGTHVPGYSMPLLRNYRSALLRDSHYVGMYSWESGFLELALQALRIGVLGVGDDFEILVLENGHGKSDFGVLDASVKGFVDGFEPLGARVLHDVANCFKVFAR